MGLVPCRGGVLFSSLSSHMTRSTTHPEHDFQDIRGMFAKRDQHFSALVLKQIPGIPLRDTIVIRTHNMHKLLYIPVFLVLISIFGPGYYCISPHKSWYLDGGGP